MMDVSVFPTISARQGGVERTPVDCWVVDGQLAAEVLFPASLVVEALPASAS